MSKETPKDDPRQKFDQGSHKQTDKPWKGVKRNSATTTPKSTSKDGTRPTRTDFASAVRFASRRYESEAVSPWRADHLVLKGHAFGIVFRKPGLRGVGIREDLEVIAVSDLLLST
jgi:hypothetical protein